MRAPDASARPSPPTDALAVAALGAAVMWLFGLGTLTALVLGHRSRRRIAASRGALGGDTWARAALAVAYGTLAALAIAAITIQAAA